MMGWLGWQSRANRSTRRRLYKYLSDGEWRTLDEIHHGAGGSRWRLWVNLTRSAALEIVEVRDEKGFKIGFSNRRLYRIAPKYVDQVTMTVV